MTGILFSAALFLGLGYILGKLFKDLNPLLMLLGFFIIISLAPAFMEFDNDFYTICLVIGGILNFKRPVTATVSFAKNTFESLTSARLNMNLSDDISRQKKQAEDDLYRQKKEVEEDLKRQKAQAEEDINRQRREAEEAIRKEREQFKKSGKSHDSISSNTPNYSSHLDPTIFADACEILCGNKNKTLAKYKIAHRKLTSIHHPDKLHGHNEEKIEQGNNMMKRINVAIATIEKRFKS